jgi:hypothetical protein
MSRELYGFLDNEFFQKMIVDEGLYITRHKMIFIIFTYLFSWLMIDGGLTHCYGTKDFDIPDIILTLVILCGNFYGGIIYLKPLYLHHLSKSWLKTSADVIDLYISKRHTPTRFAPASKIYIPKVEFTFFVNGQKYYGDRLSFNIYKDHDHMLDNTTSSKYDTANADFGRWLDTKKISVYYNPKDPNQSVVYRELQGWYFFYLFMTFLSFGFGGVLLVILGYCKLII